MMTPSERAMKWQREHPERAKASARRYAAKHRVEINQARAEKMLDPEYRAAANSQVKDYYARNPWARYLALARYRCSNPKDISYKWYGGKGIKCLLTRDDIKLIWFRDKAAAMDRPSIDRIDSAKDYTLDNCRFIELVENCRNTQRHGGKK